MPAVTADQQSNLIGSIYDCALDPVLWSPTLERLCAVMGGHSAGIVLLDFNGINDRLVRDWGPTTVWGDRMAEVMGSVKRIHRQFLGLAGPRLDEPILLPRDLAPQIDVFSTPFYQYWAAPQNIHQVLEAVALSEPTRLGLFCITRRADKGPFSADEIDLLRRLAPHIRRAITISDLLDLKSVERQAFASVIDTISAGICVVGEDGEILHANAAAREMMEKDGPIRSENGHLNGTDKAGAEALRSAIGQVRLSPQGLQVTGIGVPLKGKGGKLAVAHVLPLDRGDIRTRLVPQALAAVFIQPEEPARFADLETIGRSFGFTPAETRLVEGLASGLTMTEVAETLGIGAVTAKTHLQNVFAKCNVSRQIDLLALVGRLTPIARAPD